MAKKSPSPAAAAALRHGAEALLRQRRAKGRNDDSRATAEMQRLLHELQVHQIQLEMQNTELEQTRDRMEVLLEKYTDLYDFAPVGYFSLDDQGRIVEVNLTGAALLGVDRSGLENRRLVRFVTPTCQAPFMAFLERVFGGSEKQLCEVALRKDDGTTFWANVHGTAALSGNGPQRWCRLAVSDITSLRQAEEAQRRMEALTVTTQELTREVARRKSMGEALRSSEAHQRQLLEQSRQTQEQLRHLSHGMLHAQEEERKRISRELHDDITQTLVGINVSLEAVAREATVNPRGIKRKIARTQRLVARSVSIVHRFAQELRPTSLDDLGLIVSLHSFMKDFTKRTGIRVEFKTFAGVDKLSSTWRTVLYRVVHSALTNVAQHAQASQVSVSIQKLRDSVLMEIADNGKKSFDAIEASRRKRHKRLGLLGMRERLEMVGGELEIESNPGQGTILRARIPFGSPLARRRAVKGEADG
jgi:PAS domain S-box-containing protein